MRTMSISVRDDLYNRLKHSIPSQKVSEFVSLAILRELEKQDQELSLAYESAEQNSERQSLLNEWDQIDDL